MTTKINPAVERKNSIFFGKVLLALLILCIIIPRPWASFAELGAVIFGWRAYLHFTTVLSFGLQGKSRTSWQIGAVALPALAAALLFVRADASFDPAATFLSVMNGSHWMMAALLGGICLAASKQLDDDQPFRGYLIAATFCFVVCWAGYKGYSPPSDDDSFGSDAEDESPVVNGKFLAQYLLYLGASFLGLSAGWWKRRGAIRARPGEE